MLWSVGEQILHEVEECGCHRLEDLGLDDAPHGLSVWEGHYVWVPGGFECPKDGVLEPRGSFRPLTGLEWADVRSGVCPKWEGEL